MVEVLRNNFFSKIITDIRSSFTKEEIDERYPRFKEDRRVLAHTPSRGQSRRELGVRYDADITVSVFLHSGFEEHRLAVERPVCIANTRDLSYSGVLLDIPNGAEIPEIGQELFLRFYLPSGVLPEGYESKVEIGCHVVRHVNNEGRALVAVQFDGDLTAYLRRKRWRMFECASLLALAATILLIFAIKMDSVFYFLFDVPVFLYGLCTAAFLLTRFFFAVFYKEIPVDPNYTPTVTIVIPCFNEERWITKTIRNCIDQNYPEDKLDVILVDDGSTDKSLENAYAFQERYKEDLRGRFRIIEQPKNMGKREALGVGVRESNSSLIIFVDSDSFLSPEAVRTLVQPFKDPKMGAVTGQTAVENKWTNYLTKMQAVRYFIAFRVFKGAEAIFDTISCLSGPLACYRRDLVLKNLDTWLQQTFMGRKATFGDDRSLTNLILRHHRTAYQHSAVCYTIVPSKMGQFMRQQMRWKRSWLRESLRGASYIWKKEPFAALSFYLGLVLPLLAPLVVLRTFVYMPVVYGVVPLVYIAGFCLMTMLLSSTYLLLKKSGLWFYGIFFCLFYLTVLVWQLIPAIFTFSASNWGTRDTADDVKPGNRKARKAPELPRPDFDDKADDTADKKAQVVSRIDPMKLDPDYEYTRQDWRRIRDRNWRKKISAVFQAAALALLVWGFVEAVFGMLQPEPLLPPPDQWTQRNGFVAISYMGISLREKEGTRSVPRKLFASHMRALAEAGYRVVTTADIIGYYRKGSPLPDKSLYLMFEDGRKDSAIFSTGVLKKYNLRATMYLQTAYLQHGDSFFIRAAELKALARNHYWDVGSQGYELRYINEMPGGGHSFFLTDRLRDEYREPIESGDALIRRFEEDYALSSALIEEFAGKKPESYIFMPANMLWNSLDDEVESINARLLDKYYEIAFAREGACYNTRETAPYNLTRMQVHPDWSVNRLLMEIEASSPNRHAYEQNDEERYHLWYANTGALSSGGAGLVLTAPKDQEGFAWLRGTDVWDNVDFTLRFSGSERGTQKVYLRYASSQSYICAALSRNNLVVQEKVPGRGISTLFEVFLGYEEEPEKLRLVLIGNRLVLFYGNGDIPLSKNPIPISQPVQRGRIAIGALGEDEPYDAVFTDMTIRPIDHLWTLPDPAAESGGGSRIPFQNIRTCLMLPFQRGEMEESWRLNGPRILYQALDAGQKVFARMPEGFYDLALLDEAWGTLPPGMAARFLSGVVLTPVDYLDWDAVADATERARMKNLSVAVRLSYSAALALSESEKRPEADWIIYDFEDILPPSSDVRLKAHYDRRHFLKRSKDSSSSDQIYVWIGEDDK
ncbi:MAG: glycosyltransferase [Synergistaceae bacterium]|jgi:hyaluronan synthase|nr:glycosyltransferase [Synergistaceae bacterium]